MYANSKIDALARLNKYIQASEDELATRSRVFKYNGPLNCVITPKLPLRWKSDKDFIKVL